MSKGKKAVRWDLDVDILNRLREVASMMKQGATALEISTALAYSYKTALRDVERVRELWRREAKQDIETKRAGSLAQYKEVQMRAWEHYRSAMRENKAVLAILRLIADVEDKIADLEGTKAPRGVDVTSGGQPLRMSAKELSDDDLAAIATGSSRRTAT
jgi:hypothetical protein